MTKIAIIVGTTRPGRNGAQVADWALAQASQRTDATFELVDLDAHPLPIYDEPVPPMMGQYANDHTKAWSAVIAAYDGYIFITPEYNHSTSGVLKNAIDYLFCEWNNKACGFISYGSAGGVRAVEHLRGIVGELKMADVRQQVTLAFGRYFLDYKTFTPDEQAAETLATQLDEVIAWTNALAVVRAQ